MDSITELQISGVTDAATLKISPDKITNGQTHQNHDTKEKSLTTKMKPITCGLKRESATLFYGNNWDFVFLLQKRQIISFNKMFSVTEQVDRGDVPI